MSLLPFTLGSELLLPTTCLKAWSQLSPTTGRWVMIRVRFTSSSRISCMAQMVLPKRILAFQRNCRYSGRTSYWYSPRLPLLLQKRSFAWSIASLCSERRVIRSSANRSSCMPVFISSRVEYVAIIMFVICYYSLFTNDSKVCLIADLS